MKIKFIILALLVCLLCSCANGTVIENDSAEELGRESATEGYEYILNTSTKKYHTHFCTLAQGIKKENLAKTSDIDFIIERGYSPCSNCIMR